MNCWQPNAAIAILKERARLLAQVRRFLHQRGYWEAQTPLLSADTCIDVHIDPLTVHVHTSPQGQRYFLQTSPEFALKRLLAAGAGSLFQITSAFRDGEVGPLHNPEFTMVEWYRVGGHYRDLMTEVGELFTALVPPPMSLSTPLKPVLLSYRQAFRRLAGFDPFTSPARVLRQVAQTDGFVLPAVAAPATPTNTSCSSAMDPEAAGERDELLNFLLASRVEPGLIGLGPVFLYDFPATQAALASVAPDDEGHLVAQRFELYYRGLELCNGYQELTDADELRQRNAVQNAKRLAAGKEALPEESRLLQAMDAGLPPCTGVALGFDRLVMAALGKTTLAEVLAFSFPRA